MILPDPFRVPLEAAALVSPLRLHPPIVNLKWKTVGLIEMRNITQVKYHNHVYEYQRNHLKLFMGISRKGNIVLEIVLSYERRLLMSSVICQKHK